MPTGIVLSQADGRPMYLQIMEQIRRRVAVGDWKAGQPLPSIRQLAVDLQISVITVKRAYFELEREGIISTQHGKGSVVAATSDVGTRLYEDELARHLAEAARLAALLGLGPRELQRRIRDAAEDAAATMKEST
jgi:DNA-binding transcriptional regulator YhcF (GntR family)